VGHASGVGEPAGYARDDELKRLGDEDVALAVLDMVFSTPDWVHRRGETIVFVTDIQLRRHVTLDLTVPNPCPASVDWFDGDPRRLIPVDILAKGSMVNFDCADEDGRPFPILSRRQNGEIAWRAMVGYANDVLRQAGLPNLPPTGVELLRQVTQEPPAAALEAYKTGESLRPDDRQAAALFADPGFAASAWMLAHNFLLIGAVDARPGERRILKHSFQEPRPSNDRRDRKDQFLEAFGWEPTTIEVNVPAFSDCESYHFEAVAPDGIEFVDIVLGDEDRVVDDGYDPTWALGYRRVISESPDRAHLAVSRTSDSAATQDQFLLPRVSIRLQVARAGWFSSALLASVFVALFLTVSYSHVAGFAQPPTGGATPRLNTDPAALMVALVGIATLAVVRTGEHVYTASRIRPLRWVALLSALLPVAAAWLLVFPGPGDTLTQGWWRLCAVAWASAAILFVGWARRAT